MLKSKTGLKGAVQANPQGKRLSRSALPLSDAMMQEADFDALSEHLDEVRPIVDGFCKRHRFEYIRGPAIGRYPRIRIQRAGPVTLYFDLWMQLDKNEKRFETFRPNLPYDLYAGAEIHEVGGSEFGATVHVGLTCFAGVPFEQVRGILESKLEKTLPLLEAWDVPYLRRKGERIRLLGGRE
jgi:hypothetical protein